MRTKIYNSRINMLSLVKKHAKICELGVLKGDFAEIIMGVCDPEEFVIIDIWPKDLMSGDVNGNNLEAFKGEKLFRYVTERFRYSSSTKIHRELTTQGLKRYKDNYFDLIYIDADHTYEAVIKDLNAAFKKNKKRRIHHGA